MDSRERPLIDHVCKHYGLPMAPLANARLAKQRAEMNNPHKASDLFLPFAVDMRSD